MSAVALGFGLFVGVAIGPGTQGSLGSDRADGRSRSPDAERRHHDHGRRLPAGRARPAAGEQPGPEATGQLPGASVQPTGHILDAAALHAADDALLHAAADHHALLRRRRRSRTRRRPRTRTTDQTTTTPEDTTTALTGTVVHLNPKAGSYTTRRDGQLIAIHTGNLPDIGQNVEVDAHAARQRHLRRGGRPHSRRQARARLVRRQDQLPRSRDAASTRSRPPASRCWCAAATSARRPKLGDTVERRGAVRRQRGPSSADPRGTRGLRQAAGAAEAAARSRSSRSARSTPAPR